MFPGTHLPKPEGKARWQWAKNKQGFYCPSEADVERLKKWFAIKTNRQLVNLFGISHSTLLRYAHIYGLEKNMRCIRKIQAEMTKKICEENGYYDSLRGKRMSDACMEGARRKRESGYHPLKEMKKKNPRRYRKICEERRRTRIALIKEERRRTEIGLPPRTKLGIMVDANTEAYTRREASRRLNAVKRGYIVGDPNPKFGQRYTLFYDEKTKRGKQFEKNALSDGWKVVEWEE